MTTNGNVQQICHNVPHIRQRYNWDCGVTCVLMVLPEKEKSEFLDNFSRICQEEGFGQTTCTIDLCYLLKRFNVDHCMYTTRQATSKRSLNNFNNANNIDKMAVRISRRFAKASASGLKIFEGVLHTTELLSHILNKGPAIVLVDAGLLSCDLCKHNKLSSEFRRVFGGSYRGHYVVAAGWARGKLLYRDPARAPALCAAPPARLHAARRAAGTDCDVILIYSDYT